MTSAVGERERVAVSGTLTLVSARAQLESGAARLRDGATIFDLAAVGEVDSSALTVIFGWQRAAAGAGTTIRIDNPPPSLLTLAELYGVAEFLPLAS